MVIDWEKESKRSIRQTFYQGRLDKKLENQKIKLRDNLIRLTGTPEDILIVEPKYDSEGDIISEVLKAHVVSNVIFPPLKDLPIKLTTTEFESGYTLTNIISSYGEGKEDGNQAQKDLSTLDIIVPLKQDKNLVIYPGCKLVKVFVDEDLISSIMVFDIVDCRGDFSNNKLLAMKVKITLSTKPIDITKKLYQLILQTAKRRLNVGY